MSDPVMRLFINSTGCFSAPKVSSFSLPWTPISPKSPFKSNSRWKAYFTHLPPPCKKGGKARGSLSWSCKRSSIHRAPPCGKPFRTWVNQRHNPILWEREVRGDDYYQLPAWQQGTQFFRQPLPASGQVHHHHPLHTLSHELKRLETKDGAKTGKEENKNWSMEI